LDLKKQKKILFIVGTRPEAIKICPLIKEASTFFDIFVLGTGQHYESVINAFSLFGVSINKIFPLKKFKNIGEQLSYFQKNISENLDIYKPDLVVVHGDTTSCFAGALSAYLHKIDIAHVEAGLRTQNMYSPFPEEMFRKWTDAVAKFCYAPTAGAKNNLICEGISEDKIFVTGNTIVDALNYISLNDQFTETDKTILNEINQFSNSKNGYFLVTLHRNEIKNTHLSLLSKAIVNLAKKKNYAIIWPLHPNKIIKNIVLLQTKKHAHVYTLPVANYNLFLKIMQKSSLIITDSGGIQEEATILAKKILVLRNETERLEVLQSGIALMGGIDDKNLEDNIDFLLNLPKNTPVNTSIFGSGDASIKIVSHWKEKLN